MKRIKLNRAIAYIVIIFAILNGPLRLSENGMSSLFRIVGPFLALYIVLKCFNQYYSSLIFFIIMMTYNILVSVIFYHHVEFQEVVIIGYVFILFIIIRYIRLKDEKFNDNFLLFLNVVCFVTIILAWIQRIVPYNVPYIENATIRRGAVNVYFSNENELGSALACVAVINVFQLFYLGYKRKAIILFDIISSLILMYLNDAKLSLLGTIVGITIIVIYRFRKGINDCLNTKILRQLSDKHFFRILVVGAIIGVISLYIINPSLKTRDYDITIREMIFDNIFAVITGQEIAGAGTYHDRSTAIIYGIKEWKKTYFFGIGLGNSWTMLQMPQYYLRAANSMHNIIAQLLVELGYFMLIVYFFITRETIKMFGRIKKSPIALLKVTYLVAFIFISSQSSSGILSNYLTITTTIFVLLLDETKISVSAKR